MSTGGGAHHGNLRWTTGLLVLLAGVVCLVVGFVAGLFAHEPLRGLVRGPVELMVTTAPLSAGEYRKTPIPPCAPVGSIGGVQPGTFVRVWRQGPITLMQAEFVVAGARDLPLRPLTEDEVAEAERLAYCRH